MMAERNLGGYPVETHTRAVAIHISDAQTVAAAYALSLMLVIKIHAQVLPQFAVQRGLPYFGVEIPSGETSKNERLGKSPAQRRRHSPTVRQTPCNSE